MKTMQECRSDEYLTTSLFLYEPDQNSYVIVYVWDKRKRTKLHKQQ